MRRPFNTTCDIFAGPATGSPGAFRGSFPCRLVFQGGIHTYVLDGLEPWVPYWLTIELYKPVGMFAHPLISINSGLADVVAVPSGTIPRFVVWYTDYIVWGDQPLYYRAYLIETPIEQPFNGGVLLGGSAVVVPGKPYTLGGGVLLGGAASVIPGKPYTLGGGVLLGGSAAVEPGKPYTLGGGVLLGGFAACKPGTSFSYGGGLLLGGSATVSFVPGTISGTLTFINNMGMSSRCTVNSTAGLSSGENVTISGCTSSPGANGTWAITVFDGTHFDIPFGAAGGAESAATWHT